MKKPIKSTIPICLDGKIVGTCSSMRLSNEPNEDAPDAPYTYYAENFVPCKEGCPQCTERVIRNYTGNPSSIRFCSGCGRALPTTYIFDPVEAGDV